jgi:hypothetical protein
MNSTDESFFHEHKVLELFFTQVLNIYLMPNEGFYVGDTFAWCEGMARSSDDQFVR